MPIISKEEALGAFSSLNPAAHAVLQELFRKDPGACFGKKGPDLLQLVRGLLDDNRFPLFDRVSGILFVPEKVSHYYVALVLARFYLLIEGDVSLADMKDHDARLSDSYVLDGRGYIMSSVGEGLITLSRNYKPDQFDHLLLTRYRTLVV